MQISVNRWANDGNTFTKLLIQRSKKTFAHRPNVIAKRSFYFDALNIFVQIIQKR